jgi:transcriptional regulator with XRE-family HTH domain
MTGRKTDGQRVKERWLAIGLSQSDLAEILDSAFQQTQKEHKRPDNDDAGRLVQIAEALDIPVDFFRNPVIANEQEQRASSSEACVAFALSLLELRLLRAFHELRDQRTRRTLVYLAEQIVKRQANRDGDGRAPDDAG